MSRKAKRKQTQVKQLVGGPGGGFGGPGGGWGGPGAVLRTGKGSGKPLLLPVLKNTARTTKTTTRTTKTTTRITN